MAACVSCDKVPAKLTAQDKSSFAYKTVKDRLPIILVKTIDFIHRCRKELHKYGAAIKEPTEAQQLEIEEDSKQLIGAIGKIRQELETNKPATLFEKIPDLPAELEYLNDDVDLWNQELEKNRLPDGSLPRYYESSWLLVEAYMYRSIKHAALKTRHLKMFDPFIEQKHMACMASMPQMVAIARHIKEIEAGFNPSIERAEFSFFMQLALWANKCDLSISNMSAEGLQAQNVAADSLKESLTAFSANILCDHLPDAWARALKIKEEIQTRISSGAQKDPLFVDLVADNSGYEIYVDLCLVHFLTLMLGDNKEHVRFRFNLKRMPWFVSDTMREDVDWLLNMMSEPNRDPLLKELATKWRDNFSNGLWEIHDHRFWCLPNDYSDMPEVSPDLYQDLSKSQFIIFKGDLNYRKLAGDRKWHMLTPFRVALRDFKPAPLVALRTAKADIVVGIEDVNIYARINNNELPRDWMLSGDFGLIQYMNPM